MAIFPYLLKTTISLLLFYLLYTNIFKKEGILKFNRYYLLVSLIASFLLPFIEVNFNIAPEFSNRLYNPGYNATIVQNVDVIPEKNTPENTIWDQPTINQPPIISPVQPKAPTSNPINFFEIVSWTLIGLYVLGVLVLLFSFLYQLMQTLRLFKHNTIENISNAKLIEHNLEIMPFSIFNYILINKNHYGEKELEYVLMHEMEHINQKHSFDILLVELLKVIFWINPIVWFYESEMKQNHEYLADRGVIARGVHTPDYQLVLLTSSLGIPKFNIVNNFNQSYIKKRITMMTNKNSNKLSIWKLLLMIPVVFAIIIACAKPSGSKTTGNENIAAKIEAAGEITDFTKYIELNTPYDWVSYHRSDLFCKGTYTITQINEDGSFFGFQVNHTKHANIPVTGKLTKDLFEIYTGSPWNEIWSIKSSENGKLCGEIFADYSLARTSKLTFYLAKKIGYDELLPAALSNPGEEISKNLHLKLNEKYFYETFGYNGELAMTGWFMITNFDKTTLKISGLQWNYIGNCPGAFSGSLDDNNLTINIGEPWNEVWKAKLEGDLLKGTLEMRPTELGFVHQTQSWVMANTNHPIHTADKVAKQRIPYNVARYSGMEEDLKALLAENMKYPEQAKKDKIEGRVYVSFNVKTDGSIANLKVARKVNPLLDEEALRLVNLTDKKWVPALINDQPTESEHQLLINFRLDNKQISNTQKTEIITQPFENVTQTSVVIEGKVTDKDTKEALAFVNVVEIDNNGRMVTGTTTDKNGAFVMKIKDVTNSIQASFKGYKKTALKIRDVTNSIQTSFKGDKKTTLELRSSISNIELEKER